MICNMTSSNSIMIAKILILECQGVMMIASVFLPYYFQAVKGKIVTTFQQIPSSLILAPGASVTRSALQLLPYTIISTSASALAGSFVSRTGNLWPLLVAPPLLTAIG